MWPIKKRNYVVSTINSTDIHFSKHAHYGLVSARPTLYFSQTENIDEYERVPQYSPAIPIDMQFLPVFGALTPKILRALDVPADTTRIQLFLTIKDAQITRKSSFLTFRPYIFR